MQGIRFAMLVLALVGAGASRADASIVDELPFATRDVAATDWTAGAGGPDGNASRDVDPGGTLDVLWTGSAAVLDTPLLVANGLVFSVSEDGGIVALDRQDGSVEWSRNLEGTSGPSCVGDGLVLARSNSGLVAIELATGSVRWTGQGPEAEGGWCYVHDGFVVSSRLGGLVARDASTGQIRWSKDVSGPQKDPVAQGSSVVVRSSGGVYRAFDVATGDLRWTQTFAGTRTTSGIYAGGMAIAGSTLYGVSERNGLVAIDLAAGVIGWSTTLPSNSDTERVLVDAQRVYVVTASGTLFARQAGSGVEAWTAPVQQSVDPIIRAGAFLYAGGIRINAASGVIRDSNATPRRAIAGATAFGVASGAGATKRVVALQDLTPPTVGTTAPNPIVANRRPAIEWTAGDGGSGLAAFDVVIDGTVAATGLPAATRSFVPTSDLADGAHTTRVVARDEFGNSSETSTRAFSVDTTPPSIPALSTPAAGASFLPSPVTFTWAQSTDAISGVDHYLLNVDGTQTNVPASACVDATCSSAPQALADGTHTWTVRAVDAVGNFADSPQRSLTVDGTPPAPFALSTPADEAPIGDTTPEFSWEAAIDAGGGGARYRVEIDGVPSATVDSPVTTYAPVAALPVGPHSWRVVAVDATGNERPSATRKFLIDVDAPAAMTTGPAAIVDVARPVLTWVASDTGGSGLASFDVDIDGVSAATSLPSDARSFTPAADLSDGPHSVTLTATDASGNQVVTPPRVFHVDTTPPTAAALIAPAAGAANLPPRPEFRWTSGTDVGGSGVESQKLVVDGVDVASVAGTCAGDCVATPAVGLATGSHTWTVRVIDLAGKVTTSAPARTFTVDATPPEPFGLVSPADGARTGDATPDLTWQATTDAGAGVSGYEVAIDGQTVAIGQTGPSFSPSAALADGSHTWRVRAVDGAGNVREATGSRTFVVDTVAPHSTLTGVPTGPTRSRMATIAFSSADGGVAFACSLDGAAPTTCTSPVSLTALGDGPHRFAVRASDDVGNVETPAATASWTVDTVTPPRAAVAAAPSPAVTGAPVAFDASATADVFGAAIVSYAFDFDGDGTFDSAASPDATVSHAYDKPGTYAAKVRVTNSAGGTDVAVAQVEVRLASPAGRLGVTVNGGDQFTNDPDVTISAVWPTLAARMIVSNDGGFGDPFEGPVAFAQAWKLDSSGPERLPKTVYVRFEGGESGRETYQDDIILDETAPTVTVEVDSDEGDSRSAAIVAKARSYKLAIKAIDKTSGVDGMQVVASKARPGAFTAYKKRASVKTGGANAYVRVRDRAGNVSRWKTVKLR